MIADHRDEGTSGSGDAWHRYLWAPHERAGEASLLLAQDFVNAYFWDEDVNWMLADNLNSVIDVVGLAGDNTTNNPASVYRKEHIVYTSFGEVATAWTDAGYRQELTYTRYGYTSQEYDNVTGYQWNNLRVYDSNTATWLTNDPIEWEAGQTSFMMYAGNDPVNRTDPSGLLWGWAASLVGAAIGATVGVAGATLGAAIQGRLPTRGELAGGAIGGAVNGAVVGALATGDVVTAVGVGTLGGAAGGYTSSIVRQKIDKGRVDGRELAQDTFGGAAWGAVGGLAGSGGVGPSSALATVGGGVRSGAVAAAFRPGIAAAISGGSTNLLQTFHTDPNRINDSPDPDCPKICENAEPSSGNHGAKSADLNLVPGPNPNGLRQRAVDSPTSGEGGVYLKPQDGKTKIGSTIDFHDRYGANANNGIEVEIPQTRNGPPAGVDDSLYPWNPRAQRRFDEEYLDRMTPPEVRYRDPTNPRPPVGQDKWEKYRHIFGYGDLPDDFGY